MSKVLLGDVAAERRETCKGSKDGYPTVGLEHLTPEEITLTSWDDSSGNTFTKMFHKGDVLFGRRRAYLKKAAVAPFDGICSGDITVITAKPNYLLPELLPFIIQNDALFDFAVEKSAGSLSPRVKWEHLKNYEFSLPDMEKQHELSELLWAMDSTKKSYQRLVAATDELVKSQFIEMFGDPIENPMCWDKMPLSKSCEIVTGNTPPRANKEYYGNSVEWIKSDNIQEGLVFPSKATESLSDEGAAIGRLVDTDCLLMTCIAGGLNSIGNLAVTNRRVAFNQQINAIIPQKVNVWFMYYLLTLMRPVLHDSTNRALKCILTKGSLQKIEGIVPDMYLQEQFAAFVHQSDKSKFELEQALSELTATYKRIISEQLG